MTDNDIIKALECCTKLDYRDNWDICKKECPYAQHCYDEANDVHFLKDLTAFINRQKAEIERLEATLNCYEETSGNKKAKAEAVKEFAERLKASSIKPEFPWDDFFVTNGMIDDLVKEFTEGEHYESQRAESNGSEKA